MFDDDPTPAVLCGDLNMLRCFAGAAPARAGLARARVPTITVSTDPRDLTFASRYIERRAVVADPASQPRRTAEDLAALGQRIGGRPALFYGTDAMLLCVSRQRDVLAPHLRFLLPEAALIEALVDKTRFAELAARLDLPVPRTVTSRELHAAENARARVPPPCVIKPRTHIGWYRSAPIREEGGRKQKALLAETEAELSRRLAQMRRYDDDFVVQAWVPGGDDCILSFHVYLDAARRPVAHYVGRKIRTYPAGAGESTYLELIEDAEVTRVGLSVVEKLGLVGIAKLDFKRDPGSGRLYLLEVNPRPSLWNHLGAAAGINLMLLAYADLVGLSRPRIGPLQVGLRWLSFEGDLRAFLEQGQGLPAWLRSYAGPKVYDVFAWDDPWPAALSALRRIGGKARKMGGAMLSRAGGLR
jgi:predicted ATP-grasp superfamily ATP-dependent carboligase